MCQEKISRTILPRVTKACWYELLFIIMDCGGPYVCKSHCRTLERVL